MRLDQRLAENAINARISTPAKYLLAVAIAGVAIFLRVRANGAFESSRFSTYYPAVLMIALLCGTAPALLAVALCAAASWYLQTPQLLASSQQPIHPVALLTYFIFGSFAALLVGDLRRAILQRRDGEAHFRLMADAVPHLIWITDADGRMAFFNRKWAEYTGASTRPATVIDTITSLLHPDDQAIAAAGFEEARLTGETYVGEHRVRSASGDYRWFLARAEPYRDPDTGRIIRWYGASTDIDDLYRLQETQTLLIAELQHRTRNLLALVSSTARQTERTTSSLDEFSERFFKRLAALSRVQQLLSRESGESVTLGELLDAELSACGVTLDSKRIAVNGPAVLLPSKAVQVLALALHELTTNAVKYGALAQDQAKLSVDWWLPSENGKSFVSLRWVETGVRLAADAASKPRGFGSQLIAQAIPYDLKSEASWTLTPDGVHCELKVPLG